MVVPVISVKTLRLNSLLGLSRKIILFVRRLLPLTPLAPGNTHPDRIIEYNALFSRRRHASAGISIYRYLQGDQCVKHSWKCQARVSPAAPLRHGCVILDFDVRRWRKVADKELGKKSKRRCWGGIRTAEAVSWLILAERSPRQHGKPKIKGHPDYRNPRGEINH